MSQRKYQLYFFLSFFVVLLVLAGDRSFAEESDAVRKYDRQISDAEREQKDLEKRSRELQKEMDELEEDKEQTLVYIEKLDGKSAVLEADLADLKKRIRTASGELDGAEAELREAEDTEERQYSTMKKRIKYMYENGSEGYLELLAGSRSLSELFNRAEYVSKVSSYDRNLLKGYQELQRQIQKAEDQIQKNLKELTNRRESLQVERSSMNDLMAKKEQEVNRVQNLLDNKGDALKDTEVLLASQEEELENLMAAQRAAVEREEASRQAQAKKEEVKDKEENQRKSIDKKSDADDSGEHNTATPAPNSQKPTSSGGYCWPLTTSGRISSYFGNRTSPTAGASSYHKGIDISVPVGTGVLAAKSGTVVTATYSSSAGNYVAISHGGGVYTYYMHCSSLNVSVGQQVTKGQRIAQSGNTGISTGPHLHFAVFAGGSYVNPLNYVSR